MIPIRLFPLLACAALAACQSAPPATPAAGGKSAALLRMEQIALAAQRCWFASRDPAFRDYRMANELNSFSGRPRILLVPARSPEARPLLVVQAEGPSGKVDVFGPLMQSPLGPRVGADIGRWLGGNGSCAATA